ncbi:cytochrome P450 monooxygenase [Penicillium malachiteum]|uniref:Cytochrome P450 monooxygenase n=1 Tax=Penicillium malachiteum TaxID=1324776 RepID=A0AAD6MYU2_9EURO|nr:cytochrome P450 monooxygenase [Penicillium malachiteum]
MTVLTIYQEFQLSLRSVEKFHVCFSLLALLLAWRIWNFVIYPRIYPDEVKHLPYWIPGHAIPFFWNSNKLYKQAKDSFPQEPCALRVVGQDIVIVTSAAQIKEIDRNTEDFDFDAVLDVMYDEIAKIPRKNKSLLWRTPGEGYASIFPNPKGLSMAHHGFDMLHSQLIPQAGMMRTLDYSIRELESTLRWDSFYPRCVIAESDDIKLVSLERLSWDSLFQSIVLSFMGPGLFKLEPNLSQYFSQWDYHSWQVTYQLPGFLAKRASKPKDHAIEILRQYLEAPAEQRAGSVPFIDQVYNDYRASGLPSRDIAGIIFSILWALSSTSATTAYWMLAHLTRFPEVIEELRREITPMMREIDLTSESHPEKLVDIAKAHILKGCPILNSTFSETVRFISTGSSARQAKHDTIFGGKRVAKRTRFLIPQRIQTMSFDAFGQDADEFDSYRFARDPSLIRKVEFRGFGGGASMCRGKPIGRAQSGLFIALMLWRYDVEMVGPDQNVLGVTGKPFPRLDEARPSIGPAKPKGSDDMILRLSRRKV